MGTFISDMRKDSRSVNTTIHVIHGSGGNLISYKTATDLGLLKVINSINPTLSIDDIQKQYPHLFKGIGKLKDHQVRLYVDESVKPVAHLNRRVPFHLQPAVEAELGQLLADDIIERANGPTPWISPLVVVNKPKQPNKIRLCVDSRSVNTALLRQRDVAPTIDDVIHQLNGSRVFSKLDLRQAFLQLELEEDSRYITTFSSHIGLFRFKRLSFGLSVSSEIFQTTISQLLSGIPGVINLCDDILIYGASVDDHNKSLLAVVKKLADSGLTLHKSKCILNQSQITFYGCSFSENGVSIDPERLKNLERLPAPKSASETASLLGMFGFVQRHLANFAEIIEPLRRIANSKSPFNWSEVEQKSFDQLKDSLRKNVTTSYFCPSLHSTIYCDAGPVGVAATLTQKDPINGSIRVICHISKTLTDVQRRYSQLEKETYCLVWATERLHRYIFGSSFDLVTDCRSLQILYSKPAAKLSARLERWRLRLSPYMFNVVHKPAGKNGEGNPSDYLSRHPDESTDEGDRTSRIAEEYVNFIMNMPVPIALSVETIKQATLADNTLQAVICAIKENRWHGDQLKPYYNMRDELCVAGDDQSIVLRNNRIIIPSSLQQQTIDLAHAGHRGIVATKALLRSRVYFPHMDSMVEQTLKECMACQTSTASHNVDPLKPSTLPAKEWSELSADFAGPLKDGSYLLVIIDEYSRFPIVENVSSTSARAVIPVIDKILSLLGVCDSMRTDNGPPWNSDEWKKFTQYLGFKHRKITPLWPAANPYVERFMASLKRVIRTSFVEGKSWKQEINAFLRCYRNTPHTTTGQIPSKLLLHRDIKTTIPSISEITNSPQSDEVRSRDDKAKQRMKSYYDRKHNAREHKFSVGQQVLVKVQQTDKQRPFYKPQPYEITAIKGSMITASTANGDHTMTRNSSFFKPFYSASHQHRETDRYSDNSSCISDNDYSVTPSVRREQSANQPRNTSTARRYPQRQNRYKPRRYRDYELS